MIHELLAYILNGNEDETETWFNEIDCNEFLHPGEKNMLRLIMNAVSEYNKIQLFIKKVECTLNSKNNALNEDVKRGLYIKAFCDGIKNVLQDYNNTIKKLEEKYLHNPQLPLSYTYSSIEKFTTLFDALQSMINTIDNEGIHGCLLVGRLRKFNNSGVDIITDASKIIIKSINGIFYRQLSDWIVYGDFVDNYDEFFIRDGKSANTDFLYPEQMDKTDIICKKLKTRQAPIVRNFYIEINMIPTNISPEMAETILFLGTIVWIVRNDPKLTERKKYDCQFKHDIWDGKELEYYNKIRSLENENINSGKFNEIIEECRIKLSEYLWKLCLDEAKLLEHLQIIRDYYTLARGELFQQFIIASEDILRKTPDDSVIQLLNFIFTDTAQTIYSNNYKTYQRFELSLPNRSLMNNPWFGLEITFDITWPLHIIFHPKMMNLYNRMFSFLLYLKKVHIGLHKLWLQHMEGKNKIDRRVWVLRNHLMFLVNNLQYYLQVDVIEAQFSVFHKKVNNANKFEDIIHLHKTFMTNLLSKTYLMNVDLPNTIQENKHKLHQVPNLNTNTKNVVYVCIVDLLNVCERFCLVTSTWNFELTDHQIEVLQEFEDRVNTATKQLMYVLNTLYKKSLDEYLLQLLRQLNYNGWFSKKFNIEMI